MVTSEPIYFRCVLCGQTHEAQTAHHTCKVTSNIDPYEAHKKVKREARDG